VSKFSLITATYNSAATLQDTLESVRAQVGVTTELIVQDGGSLDDTLGIAEAHGGILIRSEPDTGLYNAMNRGIARATGDIIGIINSDDFYPSNDVLQSVQRLFDSHPEIDAVYGDLNYVAFDEPCRIIRKWHSRNYDPLSWRMGWMPPHPTFFVRRSVYERFGIFNETLRFSADYEFMLRCCYLHRISVAYLPRVLVHMRAGGVSNSSLKNRLQANREDRLAWKLNGLSVPMGLNLIKPLRKVRQWM
jgi:glycosyltransferase